jgi:hypothetical protein
VSEQQTWLAIVIVVCVLIGYLTFTVGQTMSRNDQIESEALRACVEASDGSPLSVWFCGGKPPPSTAGGVR